MKLLLEDPDVEDGIRIGDVYGFLIEFYSKTHDHNQVLLAYPFVFSIIFNLPNEQYYIKILPEFQQSFCTYLSPI